MEVAQYMNVGKLTKVLRSEQSVSAMAEGDEWQGFLGYIASGNVDKAKELLLRRGTRK